MSSDDLFNRPEAQPVLRAIAKVKRGEPADERCYFCGGPLAVQAGGGPPGGAPTTFSFTCPCGRSNGTLFGL